MNTLRFISKNGALNRPISQASIISLLPLTSLHSVCNIVTVTVPLLLIIKVGYVMELTCITLFYQLRVNPRLIIMTRIFVLTLN